jgi:hypothetical protein
MADGTMTTTTDGHGCQDMSGHLHGYLGGQEEDIMVGHQWVPGLISTST